MNYLFFLIFGLCIGSFLNVVIYRLPIGKSIVCGRSACPDCGHQLTFGDNIPIISWLYLQGQCRYCGAKISPRYPLVEALTAVLFLLVYVQYGWSLNTLTGFLLTGVLIVCAFIDIDQGIIPDRITYPALAAGLFLSWWTVGLKSALLGVAVFAGVLLLAALFSNGGMGGGDIKLAAVIGAFSGFPSAGAGLILACITGGLWAGFLLITRRAGRGTSIRFGPFLAAGGWLGFMYGSALISWYLGLWV